MSEEIAAWFADCAWWQLAGVALALNVAIVTSSVVLWRLIATRRGVGEGRRPPSRRDLVLTASTTIVNAAVLIPGWWLWRGGWIELPAAGPGRVLVEVLYLLVVTDLVMYGIHRVFHVDPLYAMFHRVHHTDDTPNNELSLFVMHPFEALGFGSQLLVLLLLRPVSVVGISIFFTLNLFVGTRAHVAVAAAPSTMDRVFGGSVMHQGHHDAPATGFGFFTTFWDRLFGSLPRELS